MNSPSSSSSSTGDINKIVAARSTSIVESLKGCGLTGLRIDKEELRQNLTMPEYLRFAIRDCIRFRDPAAGDSPFIRGLNEENAAVAPKTPMIVFINPRSGGRHGPVLKERLEHLMSEEQVIILSFS